MLNIGQKDISDKVIKGFIRSKTSKDSLLPLTFRISGEAGTGKTFMISETINQVLRLFPNIKILFCAISNQAVNNLIKSIVLKKEYRENAQIDFKTIASALSMYRIERFNTYSKPDNSKISKYDIVVCDEFSCISEEITKTLLTGLKNNSVAIFLGDLAQLPPVKAKVSELSKASDRQNYLTYGKHNVMLYSFELKEQMRQRNKIGEISSKARGGVYILKDSDQVDNENVFLHQDRESMLKMCGMYIKHLGSSKDVCIYNFTNKKTIENGESIRNFLYGEKLSRDSITEGENLVVKKGNKNIKKGTEITAETVDKINLSNYLDVYRIKYKSNLISCVAAKDESKLQSLLDYYRAEGINKSHGYLNSLLVLSYPFSKTIHSSQGSTTPYTFVDVEDILSSSNKKRLLYVAYSRASKELHTVKIP